MLMLLVFLFNMKCFLIMGVLNVIVVMVILMFVVWLFNFMGYWNVLDICEMVVKLVFVGLVG